MEKPSFHAIQVRPKISIELCPRYMSEMECSLCKVCSTVFEGRWLPVHSNSPNRYSHHRCFNDFKDSAKILNCRLCDILWTMFCPIQGWRVMTQSDYPTVENLSIEFSTNWGWPSHPGIPNPNPGYNEFLLLSFTVVIGEKKRRLLDLETRPEKGMLPERTSY
jgi:hypothetical protein